MKPSQYMLKNTYEYQPMENISLPSASDVTNTVFVRQYW